jgi:Ca2+-binding RTX toxin-like protein
MWGYGMSLSGGAGRDVLLGDVGNQILSGGAGQDLLVGYNNNDVLRGGLGADSVHGGDRLGSETSGNKYDILDGGAGDDQLDGGAGVNLVTYAGAPASVQVDLTAGSASGWGSDTIMNIADIRGSGSDDLLTGNAVANRIVAGGGNDVLSGLAGDDFLEGGGGPNTNDGGDGTDYCINPDAAGGATNCEQP